MEPRINISEFSDFCFGVKRAISIAEDALGKEPRPVVSLGPLIHNQQVVTGLSKKGLNVAGDYKKIKRGTVVTRSHGTRSDVLEALRKRKIGVVDITCPFVKNAQMLVKKLSQDGYNVIIIGDKGHPEVKSLKSFSGDKAIVIATANDAKKLKLNKTKIGIVAQTTQSLQNFLAVMTELMKKGFKEIKIFNTICSDVYKRQKSTERFARENDLVFVVGGRNSANTRRLYDICKALGTQAHYVETGREIKNKWLKGKKTIGVVSGASTPRWIVDAVVKRLRNIK